MGCWGSAGFHPLWDLFLVAYPVVFHDTKCQLILEQREELDILEGG